MPFAYFLVNEDKTIYGHAEIEGIGPKGIKFGGMGGYGKRVDPEADPENPIEPTKKEIETLCKEFEDCVPGSKGKVNHVTRCFFVQSPDTHFIVDKLTGYKRVTIGCGFSGHGFKFQPAIGEILADLATKGSTRYDINFISLKRFQRPKL